MKIQKMIALAVMAAAPAMMFAESTDRQIEDAAKSSYNFRAVLDNRVTADSKDGVVTLTGTVQDRDQKALAEDTVSNLPGVVTVVNKIEVQSEPAERSDGWIALKVKGELLVHSNVSATSTKVDVNEGVVTLTGTVDNSAQKELTELYAKGVVGVRSVMNDLTVKEPTAEARETAGRSIDDASITSEVKYELLMDHATSAIKTKVTTKDGVVMVSGDANNDAEKELVSKLASSVNGVRSVDNEMNVRNN